MLSDFRGDAYSECNQNSTDLIVSAAAGNNKHHNALIKKLLKPDWCSDICDITFIQQSPAHFKPLSIVNNKYRNLYRNDQNCSNFPSYVHV